MQAQLAPRNVAAIAGAASRVVQATAAAPAGAGAGAPVERRNVLAGVRGTMLFLMRR